MATPIILSIALGIALLLQFAAIIYALRLVRKTKYNAIWILCIIGFILIAVERYFELRSLNGEPKYIYISIALGIMVTICVTIAVMFAHRLVSYLDKVEYQRHILNRRILTAVIRTEERSRLNFSKEMHDGLGPLLSSAKMSLSALPKDGFSDKQREIIENTSYVIEEAIRSVREISNNLSPQVLLDFGLAQALHNFIKRCISLHDIDIEFKTNLQSERFDGDIEVTMYRVVSELIHNSLKHASCNHITFEILLENNTLILRYNDNGCGFDPRAVIDCGMGLSNISSRISSLNGSFDIESSLGNGMSATISITLSSK